MNPAEVYDILALAAAYDNRKFDDATVIAWHAILHNIDFADAREAIVAHFAEHTDVYLMPAHVRLGAIGIHKRRQHAERQQALQAAERRAAVERGHTQDRSADVIQLVDRVRDVLPEGDPDALRYGARYWRKQRERRERAAKGIGAEPNPHFRGWHAVAADMAQPHDETGAS